MKILALIHGYPPGLNAGGEYYMKNWFDWLVKRGHHVTVRIAQSNLTPYELDGVKVDRDVYPLVKQDMKTTDLVISHLNAQGGAINKCEWYKKPLVIVQHNHNVDGAFFAKHKPNIAERFLYCIYNTQHVKDKCKYPVPSIIMHPPIFPERVKVSRKGNKISLINLWDQKGGDTLAMIASRLKDKEFLGIRGGYAKAKQVEMSYKNITYVDNTPDIKSLYAQSRIMLMPSKNESYGMVAIEAAISGIPTIASPTPGLKESLQDAGIFVEKDDINGWIEAIKWLDDEDNYKAQSAKVKARWKEIEAAREAEMLASEKFLIDIWEKKI